MSYALTMKENKIVRESRGRVGGGGGGGGGGEDMGM